MKNFLSNLLMPAVILFSLAGCKSLDVNKQLAQKRDEIDKNEPWRYDRPEQTDAPDRPVFPIVTSTKLKNHVTVMVVEDHRLPIAVVNVVLKRGSAEDPRGLSGVMQLMGSMLKEGTKELTSLELAEAFANLGTEVSVTVNKDSIQISAPVLSDKIATVVGLIAGMIKHPRMEQEDFARVKLQHEGLLATNSTVLSYVAKTQFMEAAYGHHPYGSPNAGSLSSIAGITLQDLIKAHKNNFAADHLAVTVVGDISLAELQKIAHKNFGDMSSSRQRSVALKDPAVHKQMITRIIERSPAPQAFLIVGRPLIAQKDRDLPILEVLQNILAGSPNTRLGLNLREKKGWTYGVHGVVSPLRSKGPFLITTSVQLPYAADALDEILAELEKIRTELVTDDELVRAKNGILKSFASRYNTINKIAGSIADEYVYGLPSNYDEKFFDSVAKVTAKDILQFANKYLGKNTLTAIAVGELDALEAGMTKSNLGRLTIERDTNKKAH